MYWLRIILVFIPLGCLSERLSAQLSRSSVVQAVAVQGKPFGVARVRIPVSTLVSFDPDPRVVVKEAQGRICYPAVRRMEVATSRRDSEGKPLKIGQGAILSRIGELLRNANAPEEERQAVGFEYLFLIPGSPTSLELQVDSPSVAKLQVPVVQASVIDSRALLERWWAAYRQQADQRVDSGDYPPLVETYLQEMLGARLGLPTEGSAPPSNELVKVEPSQRILALLELLTGGESIQVEALRRSAVGNWPTSEAQLPLPQAPAWKSPNWPTPLPNPEIEPIARKVPPECFYVHFTQYSDYQWFQDLATNNGGDIAQLVFLRGIDGKVGTRVQTRLNLQSSELARVLGPTIIADLALVGHDLMLDSGPAIGVIFRAANPLLLKTALQVDRQSVADSGRARLSSLTLAGEEVSLLESADHEIRSYLVNKDPYLLVTTSEQLARRFLEVSQGQPSLADLPGFRLARQAIPVDPKLTVFAYLSSDFFQNLVSPAYLIELRRRFRAEAEISLVRMARLAAHSENSSAPEASSANLDELIAAEFLPKHFGQRPDGSGPIILTDDVIDSRRGRRGAFIPIPDLPPQRIATYEAEEYQRTVEGLATDWRELDPVMFGIWRTVGEGVDRLRFRLEVAPLVPEKYGWIAKQLGPPSRTAIQFSNDDLVHLQAHVTTDLFGGTIPPHYLFAAVKDVQPPPLERLQGMLQTYLFLRGLPGYLGAWPRPGAIDRLPLGLGRGQPVGNNMTRLLGGLYRWQANGFSVVSFLPEILAASAPQLRTMQADDSAQVRLHIGNLVGSNLESWANSQLYERALLASIAGADFLSSISDQLRVPAGSAPDTAHGLLQGTIRDPLGGEYVLVADAPGLPPRWRGSTWPKVPKLATEAPAGYQAPLLTWFRGAEIKLMQDADRLIVSGEVRMQQP